LRHLPEYPALSDKMLGDSVSATASRDHEIKVLMASSGI